MMEFEKLKSLLECPVCFEVASQPIYNCPNGHIICRICAPKLKLCPVCRTMVIQGSRNIVAERLASECDFPCRYSMQGCSTIAKGGQIASHELSCDYRPIKCVVRLCKEGTVANFLQYYEHLLLSHGISEAPLNQSVWERDIPIGNNIFFIKEVTKKPAGMICYRERFLQLLDSDENNIWIWIALCGPFSQHCSQSQTYEVTFKIRLISENLEISWTGPVHSIRETSRDVYASGLCLVTNKTVLKRFLVDNPVGDSYFRLQIILKSVKRIDIGLRKRKRRNMNTDSEESECTETVTIGEKLMNLFACGKHP